jgi:hypothetical protein
MVDFVYSHPRRAEGVCQRGGGTVSAKSDLGAKSMVHDPGGCHYIDGWLAVRPDERGQATETLRNGGFDVEDVTVEALGDILGEDSPAQDDGGEPPLGVLRLGVNPHRGSTYLAHLDRPIEASPIHGVGYEGHGGFMSGDGHGGPVDDLKGPEECEVRGLIAVIDSGIFEEELRPGWMGEKYVENEDIDIEKVAEGEASHGTFVSSVIRKLAPEYGIAFAAARPDLDRRLKSRHEKDETFDPPTHELEVLGAVSRLVRRYRSRPSDIVALNLSLGATRCGANHGYLLTLRTALDMWRRFFGYDAPIFAAGGNSPSLEPVYPGAFPWIRSVAAAGARGDQVVWRDEVDELTHRRPWITDVAPGVKIRGLSGVSDTQTVWWSGSSFATAIATSQSVTGETFEVDGAVTYWRDRSVDYGQVVGLEHGA